MNFFFHPKSRATPAMISNVIMPMESANEVLCNADKDFAIKESGAKPAPHNSKIPAF